MVVHPNLLLTLIVFTKQSVSIARPMLGLSLAPILITVAESWDSRLSGAISQIMVCEECEGKATQKVRRYSSYNNGKAGLMHETVGVLY